MPTLCCRLLLFAQCRRRKSPPELQGARRRRFLLDGSIHHHHELPHIDLNSFHRSPLLIRHQSIAASLRTENQAAGLRGRQGRNQSGDKAAPVVLAAAGGWELGAALERGLLAAARAPGRRLRALLPGEEGGRE